MTSRAEQQKMLMDGLTDYQRSLLKDDERLDDLYRCGLKLIQQPRYFCIGSDSVLLADFTEISEGERVLEVGCGNGGLIMLLYVKCPNACYTGIEVMENCADLARRNLLLNGLQEKIAIICGDFRRLPAELAKTGVFQTTETNCRQKKYDKIICNPPYQPMSSKRISPVRERAAARFELNGTLAEFFVAAKALLTPNGGFSLVVPAARNDEVKAIAEKEGFFCRRCQAVRSIDDKKQLLTLWDFGKKPCQTLVLPSVNICLADEVCKKHWPESSVYSSK